MKARILLPMALAAWQMSQAISSAQVVINEVAYDDAGTDDFEYVEIYNAGSSPVDISGWVLGGFDSTTTNPSATVPASTIIPAGGYYLFGNAAVANRNQTLAANFLENDKEEVTLRNASSVLQDEFSYEFNKGAALPGNTEGGYHGNYQSGHVNGQGNQAAGTGPVLVSLSRYIDGRDTGNNGRDFGLRRATPGAANSIGVATSYAGPNVDAAAVGSEAAGYAGAFVNPRVVDPTQVSTYNPSAIPASPQGGNAVTVWDTEFGGNGGAFDSVMRTNGSLALNVYVDPTLVGAGDAEEWAITLGGNADALHNFSTSGVNGSTGVGWLFRRTDTAASLSLINFGFGSTNTSWITLGTIDLTGAAAGWHELGLSVEAGDVEGTYDATTFTGTTAADLTGNLFSFSYREGFTTDPDGLMRPLTFDMIPEPSTFALMGLGLAGLALARRRK